MEAALRTQLHEGVAKGLKALMTKDDSEIQNPGWLGYSRGLH